MMVIEGTEKRKVKVEVSEEAIEKEFDRICGLYSVFHPRDDESWELKDGKLIEYQDISYHGSPQYKVVGEITDPNTIRKYELLSELKKIRKAEKIDYGYME